MNIFKLILAIEIATALLLIECWLYYDFKINMRVYHSLWFAALYVTHICISKAIILLEKNYGSMIDNIRSQRALSLLFVSLLLSSTTIYLSLTSNKETLTLRQLLWIAPVLSLGCIYIILKCYIILSYIFKKCGK